MSMTTGVNWEVLTWGELFIDNLHVSFFISVNLSFAPTPSEQECYSLAKDEFKTQP